MSIQFSASSAADDGEYNTMSAINACDVQITLANPDGAPIDISGSANRAVLDFTQVIESWRVFGERWLRRLACGQDAALRLDLVYDRAPDGAIALLRGWYFLDPGTPRAVTLSVPNGGGGADRYSGAFLIARLSLPLDAARAAPVLVSVELLPHGAVTHEVLTA
jgi:hypothetical protein